MPRLRVKPADATNKHRDFGLALGGFKLREKCGLVLVRWVVVGVIVAAVMVTIGLVALVVVVAVI